ncbi:MAG: ribosomal RNA small subunit methyltransferase A [Deltaproteobacteria bacterium]|jgi:16S rRNA (adenine1518-N6/adenine1519-N6)-dimethyltransferase|nr:ribosomal RNA small subunit methyltransferase A [Deltaproteobacteria bacterium]
MKADKSLGQHFLRDAEVLADIAALTDVEHSGGVLEIGPGEGALTAYLVRAGRVVKAIDADVRAVGTLRARFGDKIDVVLGDAVTADLGALLPVGGTSLPVIVGNLPYNAASAIHRRVLGLGGRIARAVFMFQKEVAERIVSGPRGRDYGTPSILTAVSAKAYLVREVPPEAFSPRPKVDSAVVLVEPRKDPLVPSAELEAFGDFLGEVFRHRRKTLANALSDRARAALDAVGIDPKRRAEEVSPEELVAMWRTWQSIAESPRA